MFLASAVSFSADFEVISHNVLSLALKLSETRLRLTQEEVTEVERGQHAPHRVSASVFVRMGLELEDQQWVLM